MDSLHPKSKAIRVRRLEDIVRGLRFENFKGKQVGRAAFCSTLPADSWLRKVFGERLEASKGEGCNGQRGVQLGIAWETPYLSFWASHGSNPQGNHHGARRLFYCSETADILSLKQK